MLIFIIGLCIGSFINVISYRFPRKLNFITDRSMCPICNHKLSYFDLIPVLSFIYLKGKCRYCNCRISVRYPLIEIISGFIAYMCYIQYFPILKFLFIYMISMILLTMSIIDIDEMLVYDEMLIFLSLFTVISFLVMDISIIERIIGFFIISLPMYLFNYIIEAFGGGDIKLISILGFMIGYKKIIISIYISIIIAGIYSIVICICNCKKRNEYIPFVPFISIGVFIGLIYNKELLFFLSNFLFELY